MANSVVPFEFRVVGLRDKFNEYFQNRMELTSEMRSALIMTDDVVEETSRYPIPFDSPLPELMSGEKKYSGLKSGYTTFTIEKYQQGLSWSVEQDIFNKNKKTLLTQAQGLGVGFANLELLLMEELLTGTAGSAGTRYTTIPYAWDGYGLTTSSTRNTVANGNIITGTGTTVDAIHTDYKTALTRFMEFKNKVNGRRFWAGINNYHLTYLISPDYAGQFGEFMDSKRVFKYDASTDKSYASNYDNVFGSKINCIPMGGLTGNDYYIIMSSPEAPQRKPFLSLRMAGATPNPVAKFWNASNSKEMYDTDQEAVSWEQRMTMVPYFWETIIKVDNT